MRPRWRASSSRPSNEPTPPPHATRRPDRTGAPGDLPMPRDPITTTTIPAPPLLFPAVLQLGLGLMAFVVLFGLPPCASSPPIDLAVLSGLGLWAGWALVRCLRRSGRRGH